jgi:hypothetical protein
VRNDDEDKLQKSVSAVSVGQEKLENRSLNQALKLQTAKVDSGPSAKLQEVTRVRGGTPLTPPERRWDGRPVCWRCRKPGHFRKESRQEPQENKNQSSGAKRRPPTSPFHSLVSRLMYSLRGPRTDWSLTDEYRRSHAV